MSLSRTMTTTYGSGDAAVTAAATSSGDTEISLSFTVADSTTNQEQQVGFDAAAIKAVCIKADGAITCKTNSTSSPAHTFTFPAGGGAVIWNDAFPSQVTNPFGTTDVTTTYWTNASGATVTVSARVLLNS